jgi:hypothetical protein
VHYVRERAARGEVDRHVPKTATVAVTITGVSSTETTRSAYPKDSSIFAITDANIYRPYMPLVQSYVTYYQHT